MAEVPENAFDPDQAQNMLDEMNNTETSLLDKPSIIDMPEGNAVKEAAASVRNEASIKTTGYRFIPGRVGVTQEEAIYGGIIADTTLTLDPQRLNALTFNDLGDMLFLSGNDMRVVFIFSGQKYEIGRGVAEIIEPHGTILPGNVTLSSAGIASLLTNFETVKVRFFNLDNLGDSAVLTLVNSQTGPRDVEDPPPVIDEKTIVTDDGAWSWGSTEGVFTIIAISLVAIALLIALFMLGKKHMPSDLGAKRAKFREWFRGKHCDPPQFLVTYTDGDTPVRKALTLEQIGRLQTMNPELSARATDSKNLMIIERINDPKGTKITKDFSSGITASAGGQHKASSWEEGVHLRKTQSE